MPRLGACVVAVGEAAVVGVFAAVDDEFEVAHFGCVFQRELVASGCLVREREVSLWERAGVFCAGFGVRGDCRESCGEWVSGLLTGFSFLVGKAGLGWICRGCVGLGLPEQASGANAPGGVVR